MEQSQLEELYERASEHYLNGRFAEALQAWRQLLSLNPADERAREGIRLAEIMADGEAAPEAAAAVPSGPVHAVPPVAPPAAAPAFDPAMASPDASDTAPGRVIEIDEDLLVTPDEPSEEPSEPAEATSDSDSPADLTPEPVEPAAEVKEDDLDDSLSVFDSLSVPGLITSPADRDEARVEGDPGSEGAHEAPKPTPKDEWIDVGDLSAVDSIPTAPDPGPEPAAAAPATFEPPPADAPAADEPAEFAPPSEQPVPSDSDAVATELQRRIDDLLDEARAAAGDGRDQDALGILSRIAILDEENLEARALEEQIRRRSHDSTAEIETWMTEGVQWLELGQTKEALERFLKVLEVAPEHLEAQDYRAKAEARLAGEDLPSSADADSEPSDPFSPESLDQEKLNHEPMPVEPGTDAVPLASVPVDEPSPEITPGMPKPLPRAAAKAKSSRRISPTLLVFLIVVVPAIGAGAWYGPQILEKFFGGATDEAANAVERAVASQPQPGNAPPAGAAEAHAESPPPAAPELSPAERADRIATSMTRGRDALAAEDYSAAIVAFNEVLAIDPSNVDARRGIEDAGAGYRAEKEANEQLLRGRQALEDGDYVSALRILYRLPDTVDKVRVAEYKVVGWYNLGLMELKAADCKTAVEHFNEALTIAPNDAHLRKVRQLAASYVDRPRDTRFYREIETLEFLTPTR